MYMKLLIAVGGGGHFSPALAVIDKLPQEWNVLLVGRKHTFEGDDALSFEYQTAQRLGIPFIALTTGRLQRKISAHTVTSLLKVPVGLAQAMKIIKEYQPDVVLSFGGYVSVPVAVAAKLQKIPIVIHEQVLGAGLSNKVVGKIAHTICLSWEQSKEHFPEDKSIVTGNPLRSDFLKEVVSIDHLIGSDRTKPTHPTLYVTGGSGGAHGINVLIEGCLEQLLEKYFVVHQTGDSQQFGDFDRLEKFRASLPPELQKRYLVKKFIDSQNVVKILQASDLVISRAGMNTVTELLYLGKPSLLIPLPYGQQNEQQTNALFFQKTGLGETYDQDTLTPDLLLEKIHNMIANLEQYKKHAHETRALIHTDAAEKILEAVYHAKEKSST